MIAVCIRSYLVLNCFLRNIGARSKKQQQAASRAAATSGLNDSTEADANASTASEVVPGPLGQPVTIEQISSLLQASQAALKAELKAEG